VPTDKIFYPMHPARNEECKGNGFFWEGHPENEMGPHDIRSPSEVIDYEE